MAEKWREEIIVDNEGYDPEAAFREAVSISQCRVALLGAAARPARWSVSLLDVSRVVEAGGGSGRKFYWTFEARE